MQVENGVHSIALDRVFDISNAVGVDIRELFQLAPKLAHFIFPGDLRRHNVAVAGSGMPAIRIKIEPSTAGVGSKLPNSRTQGGSSMLKRMTIALAGLFTVLGFVATPAANGSDGELVGSVQMFELPDRSEEGANDTILESEIPESCEAIPVDFPVRSAENNTTGPGTSISVYTDSDCTLGEETIAPGGFDDEINLPQGAEFWRVTPAPLG